MKKKKTFKIIYTLCNICILLLSIITLVFTTLSLALSIHGAKTIYSTVKEDYKTFLEKNYVHDNSYFTDITCIQMEIVNNTIVRSSELKEQYFNNNNNKNPNSYEVLKSTLSVIQDYNKGIEYKDSLFPLIESSNALYSSLNYMTLGSNALLIDLLNFTDNQEILSFATDKGIQQIHVMANISSNLVIDLNHEISFYQYILFMSLLVLIGTSVNMYRLKKRKNRFRNKKS